MNEQGEQIKKNFLQQWIRLAFVVLYIIVFGLLWRFIAVLLLVVIILQSLHRVIAAENNSSLLTFSEGLGNFLLKVLHYVLYLSDDKPIDFDAFFSQTNNSSKVTEEMPPQPEDAEDNISASSEAVSPSTSESYADSVAEDVDTQAVSEDKASEDDVFADISFTEKVNDDAGTTEDSDSAADQDEQLKKPE